MNRPYILIRILGAPLVALPVFLLCCGLLVSWYQGHTSWQIAFVAAGMAYRTLSASKRMRSYKAWRKAWAAMEASSEYDEQRSSSDLSATLTIPTLLFAIGYPAYMGSLPSHDLPTASYPILAFLWCLTCLYLLVRAGMSFMRRRTQRRNAKAQPVACLLRKASSCPTRSSATRALPDYCARLLSVSADGRRLEARGNVSASAG